jgi:hypothetical protein
MMRDFVVALRDSTFNIDTLKFSTKYMNINVLVGPKASIEAIKGEVNKFTEGFTFEKQWREKAIDE